MSAPSSIDVLENFFGADISEIDATGLTQPRLDELVDLISESANAHVTNARDESLLYPGGFFAQCWNYEQWRPELCSALLYYPRLLVHDPIADLALANEDVLPDMRKLVARNGMELTSGPKFWAVTGSLRRRNADGADPNALLQSAIENLRPFKPLVQSGVVTMRSQWPVLKEQAQALLSSMRHDVRNSAMCDAAQYKDDFGVPAASWDNIRGLNVVPEAGLVSRDEPWQYQSQFYYLAKCLAVSQAFGAVYTPWEISDLNLLRAKLGNIGKHPSKTFLRSVAEYLVPDFDLDAETAVAIRSGEDAFAEWRSLLRRIDRHPWSSREDLKELIDDEFFPIRSRIERSARESDVIRRTMRELPATLLLTGSPGVVAAAATGGNPLAVTAASAASGVLKWCWDMYRVPSPSGSDQVLAHLLRGR